ncbi:Bacteriophage protein [Mycobacteroides abscessus subsp. abscessus]|uniref:Bacteriophage protein n=1 Tax=Mycobacteroides abscessus TaxID=36809 RepID=A0AB33T6D7_9MYCO|nr:hypothetical protein [Mycobacteroides abscessus]SKK97975.1 Bacteriophage protein [Mycobacteroides abscessus subsp. massiliense]MDO3085854.1 hypothetical protein [Mycobacteroides abscessus subsp. abscessus]MDO3343044.1 hypothetical protein [Mycobacteroides abscessus subsp. abscessus]PVB17170.1 hypothetical protein DDJ68_01750 [Mycobacteroides abscessus]RIR85502.1 hypothetical protein D2E57_21790 [Mycobacteroides abscessus]
MVVGWWVEYFVSPTPGALILTGGVPGVEVTEDVFAEPVGAELTLTGSRPSLEQTVHPAPPALALTGGVPNVSVGQVISPAHADLTVTGGTPSLGLKVAPAAAAATLTGGTPTVTIKSPLSYVSANASTTSSVSIPAHQVGDLIVLCVFDSQNTAPTKPSAGGTVPNWNYIDNPNTAAGQGAVATAWFKATATNTTSGTWTWAEQMIAVVVRGTMPASPIGGHAAVGGAAVNVTAPAVTLAHTDGSSILLHFHATAFLNASGWSPAPAGYTRRIVAGPSSSRSMVLNTKDTTTTDGSVTQPDGSSGWAYAAATVEIIN